jgi:hypothetical protein
VIVKSEQTNLRNEKSFIIRFDGKFDMVPTAEVLIFYFRPDGELISDLVIIDYARFLPNYVSIRSEPKLEGWKF